MMGQRIYTIGELLGMERTKFSRKQVAEKAHTTVAYIGMVERMDRVPRNDTGLRILRALDCKVDTSVVPWHVVTSDGLRLQVDPPRPCSEVKQSSSPEARIADALERIANALEKLV